MTRLWRRRLARFLREEEGVTAVECALMLALVVVISIAALAPSAAPTSAAPPPTVVLEADPD